VSHLKLKGEQPAMVADLLAALDDEASLE
jgi:hypothetical protein